MTIPTETSRMDYVGNGATTVYPYTFKIDDETELLVVTADTNGAETTLVLNTDYTVSGVGSQSGGNVTLTTALASGYALTIQVQADITQETDIKNQGAFSPEVIEDAFDHNIRVSQMINNSIGRAVRLPLTATGIATTLANLAPGQFFRLSDDGTQLEGAQAFATLTDATQDGTTYGRKNGAWEAVCTSTRATAIEADVTSLEGQVGFKNRIINGAMALDQRNSGSSQTITAGAALAYTVDRWYAYCTGANVTGQQVAGTSPNAYNYRFTGAASVTGIGFAQRIERMNSQDLAGNTCSLSVDLANSLLSTVTWTAYYANTNDTFGTLASPTRTQIATGTFTVTSTLTRYSVAISVPAAATTGVEVVFSVGAQISGTWTVGRVQLEKAASATVFAYRPQGTELALCQRYYQRVAFGISGPVSSGSTYGGTLRFEPMRVSPTYAFISANEAVSMGATPNSTNVWADFAMKWTTVASATTYGTCSYYASLTAEL